jgi:hypothetical protein
MTLEQFRTAVADAAKLDDDYLRLKVDALERDGHLVEIDGEAVYRPDGPDTAPRAMVPGELVKHVADKLRNDAPAKMREPDYDLIRRNVNERAEAIRERGNRVEEYVTRKLDKAESIHPKLRGL